MDGQNVNISINYEIIISIRNLWAGIYWEIWPNPSRLDIWISFFIVSIHIWFIKH